MTYKEWLMSLDNYAFVLFCIEWLPSVRERAGSIYDTSEWLDFEYRPEHDIINQFNKVMRLNPPRR